MMQTGSILSFKKPYTFRMDHALWSEYVNEPSALHPIMKQLPVHSVYHEMLAACTRPARQDMQPVVYVKWRLCMLNGE